MSTKVLVVDDELEINELLGEYLGLEGIEYLQATTGQAGIHLAAREHPDAVILDLMLPDIDGFEVARAISMNRGTFDIPIIVLSCMCHDCDKEKAHQSGAMFFMNKPFLPDDLIAMVRRALEWKKGLGDRTASGTLMLGAGENGDGKCGAPISQMVADLFARTDLAEGDVAGIREAVETLEGWAKQWNAQHAEKSLLKVEYRIGAREGAANGRPAGMGSGGAGGTAGGANGNVPTVEWKLTEETPGMLAEAFFAEQPEGSGWSGPAGLLGWGAGALVARAHVPIAPPAKWMEVLAKTGAARFEKDSKAHVIRFSRLGTRPAADAPAGPVPVVEIDGTRFPTRLRDEALAAKRK